MDIVINPRWLAVFGNECWYCGTTLTWATATVDHVIPQSRGGIGLSTKNLVPACKRCNCMKKDRTAEEFYADRPSIAARRRRLPPLSFFLLDLVRFKCSTALIHRSGLERILHPPVMERADYAAMMREVSKLVDVCRMDKRPPESVRQSRLQAQVVGLYRAAKLTPPTPPTPPKRKPLKCPSP